MQPWCPQRLPLQGNLYRVIREYRLLIIVALIKANALTVSKVYSGDYFYVNLTPSSYNLPYPYQPGLVSFGLYYSIVITAITMLSGLRLFLDIVESGW